MRIVLEIPETEAELAAFQQGLKGNAGPTLQGRAIRLMDSDGSWRFASLQLVELQRFPVDEIVPVRVCAA